MKLCAAQLAPLAGDVDANVARHLEFAELAALAGADCVVFPELSVTGYEPSLADTLATDAGDPRFATFDRLSNQTGMAIAVGAPLRAENGVQIGMLIFEPGAVPRAYAKQLLHEDECGHFCRGEGQLLLEIKGYTAAPAICHEALQAAHGETAARLGADIYLASVAKHTSGVARAFAHLASLAREQSMTILMANSTGPCDDFVSAGCSAAWNSTGRLLGQAGSDEEGLLLVDLDSEQTVFVTAPSI